MPVRWAVVDAPSNVRFVELVAALIGAVLGGSLVLVGDRVARREEWRRATLRALANAAADLATAYIRVAGEATDARERHASRENVGVLSRPDRYEALTRFFMQPGSESLRREAIEITDALKLTLDSYSSDDAEWLHAREAWKRALFALEAAVRDIVRAGKIPED